MVSSFQRGHILGKFLGISSYPKPELMLFFEMIPLHHDHHLRSLLLMVQKSAITTWDGAKTR